MRINRDLYLQKLINRQNNGMIKVITGVRRSGKSYLLDPIFTEYLISEGIEQDHIIKIELDQVANTKYHRNSLLFDKYIRSLIKDEKQYYFIFDEIQLVEGFEFVLNGLLYLRNVDVYVTGSNSKFLSKDIITEFRGRGDQIHIYPLSFSEYYESRKGDKWESWNEYMVFGGMPLILSLKTNEEKAQYLKDLFELTYYKDIIEKYKITRTDVLDEIVNIIASSVGSLTNPRRIHNTFVSNNEKELSVNTVTSYIDYLEDAFIIEKSLRYDIKGRKYINTPMKYYFSDIGLRNAKLNFRQQEDSHIMENIIYNELHVRGFNVDVGVVEIWEGKKIIKTEVDFVCNQGYKRYYIQSVLSLDTREKTIQETRPFQHIPDGFKRVIVTKYDSKPWYTEEGILVLGIMDFLLDKNSLEK